MHENRSNFCIYANIKFHLERKRGFQQNIQRGSVHRHQEKTSRKTSKGSILSYKSKTTITGSEKDNWAAELANHRLQEKGEIHKYKGTGSKKTNLWKIKILKI